MAKKRLEDIILSNEERDLLMTSKVNIEVSSSQHVIVPQTHTLLVMKGGVMKESYESGDHKIIRPLKKLFGYKEVSDRVDLIYINTNSTLKLLWGTPSKLDIMDNKLGIPVSIGMNGSLVIKISNIRKFSEKLALITNSYSLDKLKDFFKEILIQNIKECIAKYLIDTDKSFYDVWKDMTSICDSIIKQLGPKYELYGVTLYDFAIAETMLPEETKARIDKAYEETLSLKAKGITYKELREMDNKDILAAGNSNQMMCPECRTILAKDVRFCNNCGHKFVVHCDKCNIDYKEGTKFCNNCGSKLD